MSIIFRRNLAFLQILNRYMYISARFLQTAHLNQSYISRILAVQRYVYDYIDVHVYIYWQKLMYIKSIFLSSNIHFSDLSFLKSFLLLYILASTRRKLFRRTFSVTRHWCWIGNSTLCLVIVDDWKETKQYFTCNKQLTATAHSKL